MLIQLANEPYLQGNSIEKMFKLRTTDAHFTLNFFFADTPTGRLEVEEEREILKLLESYCFDKQTTLPLHPNRKYLLC